ncbi:MAG: hypothetical protein ACSHXB_03935 [Sulfitobacter sp.]
MTYPGGKNGGGAYQRIINHMPPHRFYIEPFLGSGAVLRNKRLLHNWRLHHSYPMVRARAKLTRLVKSQGGFTARRLKRTSSIRKKLFRGSAKLGEMQDLVGCRAIVNNMDDLKEVLSKYRSISEGGTVRRSADYITNPKASGYRSVHLILRFGEGGVGEKHSGCNVEVQLRTQLQHVWGTTVEAVGSMRNEDLKAGEGNPEWLRFFNAHERTYSRT